MKIKIAGLLLALLLATSFLSPATAGTAEEGAAELKVAIHTDENTLTPFTYVRGYPGLEVMRLIFDSLFMMDEQNRPLPWMVDEYEVDEEFAEYKVSLHPGQYWHDGVALTAEDIAFTFDYPLGQSSTRWRRIAEQVESVEVLDELNFILRLNDGNPDFISQALTDMPVIPRHIYEDVTDAEQAGVTIGSGPYRLAEYRSGQHYILEAMEGYFKGDAAVTRIIMPIMTDTTTIFQSLRTGSIDAATANVAPELVGGFDADQEITVVAGPGLATTLLQINNEAYPFSLPEMRKAVALALDLEELVEVVLLGYGHPGSLGFYHPRGIRGTESLVPQRDLAESNEILDRLGFARQGDFRADGEGNPLRFDLLVYGNNPLRIRTAEVIAEQLKEAGLELKVVSLEPGTLDDLVWPGFDVSQGRNYTLSMWGWSAPVQLSPEALMQLASSDHRRGTLNIGAYAGAAFDSLADRYAAEKDPEARAAMIKEMQELIAEDVPFIPLYYPDVIMAYRAEAYAGWVMQQGNGIMNKMSFLPGFLDKSAASAREEQAGGESGRMLLYLLLAAAAVILLALMGRKKKRDAA